MCFISTNTANILIIGMLDGDLLIARIGPYTNVLQKFINLITFLFFFFNYLMLLLWSEMGFYILLTN